MNEPERTYRIGLILVTASAIAWSTTGFFMRLIDLDSATTLIWRGVFGALGMLVALAALEGRTGLRAFARMGKPGWVFAIVSAFGMLCFITSLRYTTVAHVSIVYATVPLVAAALAWALMRETPAQSAILASVGALIGVAIMVGLGTEGDWFGDLLAFGMTLSLAVMMVISRRYHDIPILPAACLSALLSSIVAIPFGDPLNVSSGELGLLAVFGIVNSALGLSLFTIGARLLPAIETALIGALDAPLAPIWVWLIFAETPSDATLAGGALVFVAVLGHILVQARKRPD